MGAIRSVILGALILAAACGGAKAADDSVLCRAAIAATERSTGIPDAFLSAIGRVESGRPVNGRTVPWPWTINAAGQGHFYASKAEAVAAARSFQAAGERSIDVGCLQVNLAFHPEAFASLDQAFDPAENAAYAARFLRALHEAEGSWPRAAAAYHSQTPALGAAYQAKVLETWSVPEGDRTETRPGAPDRPAQAVAAVAPKPPTRPAGMAQGPVAALPPPRMTQRILIDGPAAPGQARSLAAYRAMPVRLAARAPEAAGPFATR